MRIFAVSMLLLFLLFNLPTEANAGHNEQNQSNKATRSPSNPTGTTSTTGVMMGLAGTITPTSTGTIFVFINGDVTNNTSGDAAKLQLRVSSTGGQAAPANAAAASGTAVGGFVQVTTSTNKIPFCLVGMVSGLTVNVSYWIDVQLAAVTAGTASIADVNIVAFEH